MASADEKERLKTIIQSAGMSFHEVGHGPEASRVITERLLKMGVMDCVELLISEFGLVGIAQEFVGELGLVNPTPEQKQRLLATLSTLWIQGYCIRAAMAEAEALNGTL